MIAEIDSDFSNTETRANETGREANRTDQYIATRFTVHGFYRIPRNILSVDFRTLRKSIRNVVE